MQKRMNRGRVGDKGAVMLARQTDEIVPERRWAWRESGCCYLQSRGAVLMGSLRLATERGAGLARQTCGPRASRLLFSMGASHG
jgi:hypothetical protein